MSAEQAKEFMEGFDKLVEEYKTDSEAIAKTYSDATVGLAQEFADSSHTFAIDMTARADEFIHDIKELYDSVYPPEEGGTPEEGSGSTENPPYVTTGPAPGIPTPKGKK